MRVCVRALEEKIGIYIVQEVWHMYIFIQWKWLGAVNRRTIRPFAQGEDYAQLSCTSAHRRTLRIHFLRWKNSASSWHMKYRPSFRLFSFTVASISLLSVMRKPKVALKFINMYMRWKDPVFLCSKHAHHKIFTCHVTKHILAMQNYLGANFPML